MVFKRRDVDKALKKKGFTKKNKDHKYYHLLVDGKQVGIYTKISHGGSGKTIPNSILHAMANQMHLSYSEFTDFVNCDISGDDYIRLLKSRNVI